MTPNVQFTLYAAAAGKAILNCLSESEKVTYFKKTPIKALTNQTATTEAAIRKKIMVDTKNNVTISYGENSVGVIALAIPILREDQAPIGALSIVVPEVRFNATLEKLCRESLITAAKKVDYELQTI
jgi:DNA-binding IclR family transcriptional regulator